MDGEYVSIKALADEFGLDRSNMRKYVLGCGITPGRIRTADSGNQAVLVLTGDEAEEVRRKRHEAGYAIGSGEGVVRVDTSIGRFYVIQLIPEFDPGRIKMGFAADVAGRLAEHRTSAPTAVLAASWPCKRAWEGTAMDCLAASCRLIYSEVYEADDVAEVVSRGDAFFALMPSPEVRPALSIHSPHNT